MQTPIPIQSSSKEYLLCLTCREDWLGVVQGAILALTRGRYWDGNTGVITDAQQIAAKIYTGVTFVPLQDIVDAINSLQDRADILASLDSISQQIASLSQAVSNQSDTISLGLEGVETSIDGLELVANVQNSYDDSDLVTILADIFNAINSQTGELTLSLQNLAQFVSEIPLPFIENEDGLGQMLEIFDLIYESMELARAYEGVKVDFYGQTMTTQSGLLEQLARVIEAKQTEFTVFARPYVEDTAETPSLTEVVVADYEVYLNALTAHVMIERALRVLAEHAPDGLIYPSSMKQAVMENIIEASLFYIKRELAEALVLGVNISETITSSALPWSWSAVADEWNSYQELFVCEMGTGNTDYVNDPVNSASVFASQQGASQALQDALLFIGGVDVSTYIWNKYLGGDGSKAWNNFNLIRTQLSDGFDPDNYICV